MGPKRPNPPNRETRSGQLHSLDPAPGKNPIKREIQQGLVQSSEPSLPSPQGTHHPKTPAVASHDANRLKCCIVCWRWTKIALPDGLKTEIQNLFDLQIDFSDRRVPLGMCSTCKVGLYAYKSTKINSKNLVLLHKSFDFIKIPPPTRSEQKCSCQICVIAKGPIKNITGSLKTFTGPVKKLESIPENVPKKPEPEKPEPPPCNECLSPLGPGLPHICNLKTLEENLLKISKNNPKVGERVATRILRNKDPSPGGRVQLATGGSSTMKVLVDAPKGILQKKQVSATQLHAFCLDLGKGIGVEKMMGAKLNEWFGKGSLETGYEQMLTEMSRLVSGKCHLTELDFKDSDDNLVKLPVWAVNDLNEFLTDIHDNRQVDFTTTTILLGTDMGQKFLKFTLQVIDNAELEGTASNVKYKTTGVNRIYYFALCDRRVPENNHNVAAVFNLVKAHLVKYFLTSDLAMLNKFYGKQSCASMHPCYVCPAPKNDLLNPNYQLETPESALKNYQNWRINSGNRKDLKDFNNQEFLPVGIEHMSPEEMKMPILLKSPCPPLHLLLSTNTLVRALELVWEFGAIRWMRQSFQSFRNYFGGTLEGNQCSTLIENYAILENLAENYSRIDVKPFVRAFKALNSVKSACFGMTLGADYAAKIDEFRDALVALDELHKISVTPKFHMICIHVKQICQMTKKSLQLNEQALESSHSKFKALVQRFAGLNPDTDNPLYALNILRAFEVVNSNAAFRDSL